MCFFRRFAAPVVVAVFGTVSFLGTGLHLVPGCNHFHSHGSAHCCTSHGHCHHHDADPSQTELSTSDADCAICQFLAIPQVLTPPVEILTDGNFFEPLVARATLQPTLDPERIYSARGPPRFLNA